VFEEKTGNLSSTISISSSRVGEINNLGVAFFKYAFANFIFAFAYGQKRLRLFLYSSSPFGGCMQMPCTF